MLDATMVGLGIPDLNLFGPTNRDDDMGKFADLYKAKYILAAGVYLVGRKDGSANCFTIRGNDVGFYLDTPQRVMDYLNGGEYVEAEFSELDPKNKYVALDLIAILKSYDSF